MEIREIVGGLLLLGAAVGLYEQCGESPMSEGVATTDLVLEMSFTSRRDCEAVYNGMDPAPAGCTDIINNCLASDASINVHGVTSSMACAIDLDFGKSHFEMVFHGVPRSQLWVFTVHNYSYSVSGADYYSMVRRGEDIGAIHLIVE